MPKKSAPPKSAPPLKDDEAAHPVASQWRPTLVKIAKALAEGDYELARGIPSVAQVSKDTAQAMQEYVEEYGETLVDLPDETWDSSVAQWMGTHWDVILDLWTDESGSSDLVLNLRVFEDGKWFRYEIDSLHVP